MDKEFKPYVSPDDNSTRELTFRAVCLGAIMAVGLGGANTYLGLKAGMTVAATFPAAVIAMAVLRPLKGTILEENLARTTGAVGEALAAGADDVFGDFFGFMVESQEVELLKEVFVEGFRYRNAGFHVPSFFFVLGRLIFERV